MREWAEVRAEALAHDLDEEKIEEARRELEEKVEREAKTNMRKLWNKIVTWVYYRHALLYLPREKGQK